jgi:tetratricopeptide (TPR) repeat protein
MIADIPDTLTSHILKVPDELRDSGDEETYSEAAERVGYLLCNLKRYAEAIEPFEQALLYPESDDRKRQLCLYLGVCHLENGNLKAAEGRLEESLPANCGDSLWTKVQFQLGRLYFQQREYIKARTAFELCELSTDEGDIELRDKISHWLAGITSCLPKEIRETRRIN